jgi:hypothetical protein|tara:strand:+ start:2729 stop:3808 length:1080 start_codon:yes stop_codon:yes gene_type:complete
MKYFYALVPLTVLLSSIRLFGAVRAIEAIVFLAIIFSLVRLAKFSKVRTQTFLVSITCLAMVLIGLLHASAESISYSLRAIFALSLFHLTYRGGEIFGKEIDYRFLLLIFVSLYFASVYSYFWEYSFVFCSFVIIFYGERRYTWLILSVAMMFLVNQRAPIVAIFLYAGLKIMSHFSLIKVAGFFIAVAIAVVSAVYIPAISESRVVSTLSMLSINNILQAWNVAIAESINTSYDVFVYDNRSLLTADGDLSAHLRIRKWSKAYTDFRWHNAIFGLGPGYFGRAADSGFIRLLVCYGAVVGVLFFTYMRSIYLEISHTGRGVLSVLLLSNLFLDLTFSVLVMGFSGWMVSYSRRFSENG